jgi:hypothetical protein
MGKTRFQEIFRRIRPELEDYEQIAYSDFRIICARTGVATDPRPVKNYWELMILMGYLEEVESKRRHKLPDAAKIYAVHLLAAPEPEAEDRSDQSETDRLKGTRPIEAMGKG